MIGNICPLGLSGLFMFQNADASRCCIGRHVATLMEAI